MNRKHKLLNTLKKQVLELKSQLCNIEKPKQRNDDYSSVKSRSLSQQSRLSKFYNFDSRQNFYDKGVKKFPEKEMRCKNISELIN